jgi:hypothetical protein
MKGVAAREERTFKRHTWQTWHTAALIRMHKLPKLDTLVEKATAHEKAPGERKTPEELLAVAQAWAAVTAKRNG